MSTNSVAVIAGDSRSLTSEAPGRSSSTASHSNTSRRGSSSNNQSAPMSIQRSRSINIRDLLNTSNAANDFYVPEVFDAMDEGMQLEEAFIEAQRAALAAINDAALAKAIQESEREAALPRTRSVEPSRHAADPKYALVSPSEFGPKKVHNHGRSGSGSSASTASTSSTCSSASSASSNSTAASSLMSSSVPKAVAQVQPRPSPVKSASTPAVATASSTPMRTPSSVSHSPPKVPVLSASPPKSSLSMSRPPASSPSKSLINPPTSTASTKAHTAQHQISNQPSPYLTSTSSSSSSKSLSMNPASESGLSRKALGAPVAQPVAIINKPPTHLTSSSLTSTSAMSSRTSTSPSAKDLAMGVMSSTSAFSSDSDDAHSSRHNHNIRRLKCSRCSGSSRVKCRCPLSYLLAVEQSLAVFDKELVKMVAGESPSKATTEKQRQLFLARVLLRNESATRPFESVAVKTFDALQKLLVGLKDVTSASLSSDDSDSSDSPEFDCPSSLDLHLYLQSLFSASFLPSFIHFFLSHPNAQDWMKFAELYIGILTFLRTMVECGGGSILSEPLVAADRRYHNSGLTSSAAASSIWDVVLNRLERQTRPELIKAATAIKFGGTMDKVNRMCDGIMWLVLQDLTD